MRNLIYIIIGVILFSSCDYEEDVDLCRVEVRLIYPDNSIAPYAGVPVECKDMRVGPFVCETDGNGCVVFSVPPGMYEFTTTSQFIDTSGDIWWRYIFNATRSMVIVSPEYDNRVELPLKMSKKRVVH